MGGIAIAGPSICFGSQSLMVMPVMSGGFRVRLAPDIGHRLPLLVTSRPRLTELPTPAGHRQ